MGIRPPACVMDATICSHSTTLSVLGSLDYVLTTNLALFFAG